LELVHAHLRRAAAPPDLLYGDSIDVQPDGTQLYRSARKPSWMPFGMFTSHQAMFFRRARRPELRYELRFPISGDYAFVAAFLDRRPAEPAAACTALPVPICKFALGGQHFQKRSRGIDEDFIIRREFLHRSAVFAGALWIAHRLHHRLKVSLPRVMQRLRYTDADSTGVAPR
jgi:putative colanic acid biosynthesis glycosyltransferase